MNIRQQIVDHLKSQKNATIASVAKATEIDRTVVRYHLRAMAKLGLARVGKGTSGPNGSAAASILDGKLARWQTSGAQFVAAANTGCLMHIAAGAAARGVDVGVVHPIEIIEAASR